jgi:mono/diheme cytochrome c family protein
MVIVAGVLAAAGCSDNSKDSNTPASRGRRTYVLNCTACHNSDPAKDGPMGPALKGSSQELLEAKVLRSAYPPGYKPKRKTSAMPTYLHVKPAIPDLAAYLR